MIPGLTRPTRHGWGLLLPIAPLCAVGLLSIQAILGPGDGTLAPAVAKQLVFVAIGLVAMTAAVMFGYHRVGRIAYALFGLALLLLLWLALDRWIDLPLVDRTRSARRWIQFGPGQIQPSELAKIAYVLALAWYLRYRENYRTLQGLIPPFVLTLVPMVLILLQPDLGTVLLFLPVLFAMVYAAGARGKHLLFVVLMAVLCMPLFWAKMKGYQRVRITGVVLQSDQLRAYLKEHPKVWDAFRPSSTESNADDWYADLVGWETGDGMQLIRSKMAIAGGGVRGHGWRGGFFSEYNWYLPEGHNDFIFAMIAHQWGLIGALLVLMCYVFLVLIGYDLALNTNDPFGRLVAVGLSTLIAVQTLPNLCMTVGLGPVTGVTLPFVSAGGSSMVASFLSIGLLISVAHHRPILIAKPPFEFKEEDAEYRAHR